MYSRFKILTVSFLLALSVSGFSAQISEEQMRTVSPAGRFDYNWFNGYFWNNRMENSQSKTYFILGLGEGVIIEQKELCDRTQSLETKDLLEKVTLSLVGSQYKLSDILNRIDEFYKLKVNLNIPIAEAYRYVLLNLRGSDNKQLQECLNKLRTQYSGK